MQQSFWMPHLRICLRQMRPDVPLRSLVTTRYNFWNSCHLLARFLPAPVFHQALILPPQWQPRESKPVSFFPFGFSVLFGFTLSSKQVQDQQNICRRFFRAETNIDGKQQSFGSPVLMLFSSKTFHKTMRLHSATEVHSLKLNPKNDLCWPIRPLHSSPTRTSFTREIFGAHRQRDIHRSTSRVDNMLQQELTLSSVLIFVNNVDLCSLQDTDIQHALERVRIDRSIR